MKRLSRRLLILMAAMVMCLLMGTVVSAASNEKTLPLDGKEREFTKLGGAEDEPAQVGATTKLTTSRVGYNSYYDAEIYRIFVKGYGLLTVSGRNSYGGSLRMQLLNRYRSNVNASGGWKYISPSQKAYYGVQRGPYYIMVYSSTYNYYLGAGQALKSNRGGSSQYYSYYLTKNKTYTGVMPVNEYWSNCDWYRFYLPRAARIRLYFKTCGDGYMTLKLYGPGISYSGETIASYTMNKDMYYNLYRTYAGYGQYSRPAGWYYVKIMRSSSSYKRSSCSYWLRWKTY